ncbi:response regulator [Streptomyces sp. ID05-26A]|nr:response regulator [Streptomyces sp. ID05-26A]
MTEVLVVDDSLKTAQLFASLVQSRTGLKSVATDNPVEALRIVREGLVKVVLLDQRMPEMSGTELFRQMRAIRDDVRAIMLTGEADAREVGDALTLGFSDYLEKGEIGRLATAVLEQSLQYSIADQGLFPELNGFLLVDTGVWYKPWSCGVEYRIHRIDLLDDKYVPDLEWETVLQLNAGENKEFSEKLTYSRGVKLEKLNEKQVKSSLRVSVNVLDRIVGRVEVAIKSSLKESLNEDTAIEQFRKTTYSLPAEPVDPSASPYVVARNFQRAPVYKKWLVVVNSFCRGCLTDSLMPLVVLERTRSLATRHQNTLSDGRTAIERTGEIRG